MSDFQNVTLVGKDGATVVATTAVDLNNYLYADGMIPVGNVEQDVEAPPAPEVEPSAPDAEPVPVESEQETEGPERPNK